MAKETLYPHVTREERKSQAAYEGFKPVNDLSIGESLIPARGGGFNGFTLSLYSGNVEIFFDGVMPEPYDIYRLWAHGEQVATVRPRSIKVIDALKRLAKVRGHAS